jgi:hypothetical protein
MATVYQLPTQLPGSVGINPNFKFMVVGDNLATVTTAGYLNQVNLESYPLQSTDLISAFYSFNPVTQAGTYGLFSVAISNGVITLSQASFAGEVTLPTIVNHIATYTNVSGGLSEDAATAINGGNIQAGLSGTAGQLSSYPGTPTKGALVVAAVANTGNTLTTISNAAMGQASVISIPDPGAATADFVVAPAALVNGNLVEASGTAGLIADSGITAASVTSAVTQLGQLQQISVTLTPAQVIASYATPIVLIPAVAGKVAIVHSANVYTASTGNTPFATGVAPIIQYGTTAHGAGTIAVGTGLVTGDITAAASQVRTINAAASAVYTGITNTAVTFSCTTAYTGGTGTNVTFTLVYELITATV